FADGLDWDADGFAATGYYRRGVTPGLTLGAGATIAEDGYVGVAGNLVAGLPYGAGQLDAAWSRIDDPVGGARTGFAVEASYDADFEGFGVDRDELNLRAAYRSEDFTRLGEEGAGLERLSATGSYRIRLEQGPVVNLGAGYARSGDLQDVSLRAGVSHSFGSVSASAAVEHVLRNGGRGDETRVLVTASMPLGEDRRVRGAYSSARNRATVEYEKRHQGRVGQYGYALRAEHDDDSVGLYGRADYIANRFDASVTLDHAAPDVGALFDDDSPLVGALRVSSGVAFADGRVGVGRRVGHGFLLVDRHPTLSDSTLSIGDSLGGRPPIVRTDGFGPMVAPLSGDYRFSQVSLNLEDAPLGYDIGSGVYAVQGGARVGARTIVGSDAFYSARGVLQDAQGQPVALQYGRLASLDGSAAFDVFTNSAGIFFASGLKPGAYDLELAGARARIEISPPTQGALIELGAVTLGGGS
ncbi:fimbria/pilus outer membrane usher protein, partial [Neomegalonema sp.]|uniref:fimbria/pilus outer membrane usher protein n=1 Tax=Neomegalonema sp. TaxID=2039713 RepID=UPI002632544B